MQDRWHSAEEGLQQRLGTGLGLLSPFSSQGPSTRLGSTGVKPDLCAPGSFVVSARAGHLAMDADTVDAELMVMQGTSMAAPHVTGTVAAMLARDPSLDLAEVRRLLRRTARSDAATGLVPNFWLGLWQIGQRCRGGRGGRSQRRLPHGPGGRDLGPAAAVQLLAPASAPLAVDALRLPKKRDNRRDRLPRKYKFINKNHRLTKTA